MIYSNDSGATWNVKDLSSYTGAYGGFTMTSDGMYRAFVAQYNDPLSPYHNHKVYYESYDYGATYAKSSYLYEDQSEYNAGFTITCMAVSENSATDPMNSIKTVGFAWAILLTNATYYNVPFMVQDTRKINSKFDGSMNVTDYLTVGKDLSVTGNINLSGALTFGYSTAPALQTQMGYITEASGNLINYTTGTNSQPITGWTTGAPKTLSKGVWLINYYIYTNDAQTFNITDIRSGLSTTTGGAYTWNVRDLYYRCPATFSTVTTAFDFCTQITGILNVSASTNYTFDVNLATSVSTSDWNFDIKAVRMG